ncbi:hypothetical protein [Paenibacillus sp. HW567]|uniref:hypothetical protein n=1 Tax=Paenibacillus sp. HW567 TaxID=1034769 RepID=UPI00037C3604|nr:hypothetical protein [Paenibacillus sp. HW567]
MNNDEQLLERFGIEPENQHRDSIRQLLQAEIKNEASEDNEYLRTLCILLFSIGIVEDTLLIWAAKRKNFDASAYIDVQLLCGAGVKETMKYLQAQPNEEAQKQLAYLQQCEPYDLEDFSKKEWMDGYKSYYGLDH